MDHNVFVTSELPAQILSWFFKEAQLLRKFKENENVKINEVIEAMKVIDDTAGLKEKLSTHHRRDQHLKQNYSFIEPKKIVIGKIRKEVRFYYHLPVEKTLTRLLEDPILRNHIIQYPSFPTNNVSIEYFDKKIRIFETFDVKPHINTLNVANAT